MSCLLAVGISTPVRADQVIVNGVNQTNVKIVGLDQGKLQFRLADGRTVSAWIDEVQLILVDRGGVFEDFNQAEQFLHDGEPLKAVARYERMLRLTQEFWPDLIACRLATAHDRAGQIDRTTQYFVRIVNGEFSGPATAARLYPRNIPDKRDGRVARALDQLAEESRKLGQDDRRVLLDVLRYEMLSKTDSNAARPLARNVSGYAVPAPARTQRVFSIVLQAMQDVFSGAAGSLAAGDVERAIRDCPEDSLPGFLILKGQLLLQSAKTREEIMHAAWAFLRVPIHMPDSDLAPKALLEAAMALRALQRPEQAQTLLAECLNHPRITGDIRREAERPVETPQPMSGKD